MTETDCGENKKRNADEIEDTEIIIAPKVKRTRVEVRKTSRTGSKWDSIGNSKNMCKKHHVVIMWAQKVKEGDKTEMKKNARRE